MTWEKQVVTTCPEIMVHERGSSRNEELLLLACDGVWDVFDDEAAGEFLISQLEGPASQVRYGGGERGVHAEERRQPFLLNDLCLFETAATRQDLDCTHALEIPEHVSTYVSYYSRLSAVCKVLNISRSCP